MFQILPTYEVTLNPDAAAPRRFRVPVSRLDGFLAVLIFNGETDFRVMQEADGAHAQPVPDDGVPPTASWVEG